MLSATLGGHSPFSEEVTEGLRDGGRDEADDLADLWGVKCPAEVDGSPGLTVGDECDRFRLHAEYEPLGSTVTNDFCDHVLTLFNVAAYSASSSGNNGTCSSVGVEGGVLGEAKTSNWRER